MIKKIIQNDFFKKSAKVFVINWSVFLIDFIIGVLIVNYYESTGKGQFSGIIAFVGVLATILSLGLNNSRVYFQNKLILKKEDCFTIQMVYQCLLLILLLPVIYLFSDEIFKYLEIDFKHKVLFLVALLFYINSQILTLFLNTGYLGEANTNRYRRMRFSLVTIKLISVLLCIYFNLEIVSAIFIIVSFELFFLIYTAYNEVNKLSFLKLKRNNLVLDFFVFGFKANLTATINNVIKRFDYYLITSSLGVSMLGKYSVALIFYQLMISIPQAINSILFGKLTNSKEKKIGVNKLALMIFIICLLLGSILALLSKTMINIFYGKEFLVIVPVAIILTLAGAIQAASSVFKTYLISENKAMLNTYEQIITGFFQILFMLFLIKRYDVVGVGLAILIGSVISLIFRFYFYKKYESN